MGAATEGAFQAGVDLGVAAYQISFQTSATQMLSLAKDWLAHLSKATQHQIRFDPSSVHTYQDVTDARQAVGSQISAINGKLGEFYMLGLHLGMATGQLSAPNYDWKIASGIAKAELSRAIATIDRIGSSWLVYHQVDLINVSTQINTAKPDPTLKQHLDRGINALRTEAETMTTIP